MYKKSIVLILTACSFATPAYSKWSEPVLLSNINDPHAEDWAPFLSSDGLTLYFGRVRTSDSYYGRIFEAIRNEPIGPFTTVRKVSGSLNSPANTHVLCPWVSCDNLRMYYNTQKSGIGFKLRFSERKTTKDPWPMGTEISELNTLERYIATPNLTGDELIIFFQVLDKPGGQHDIWMASRSDRKLPFKNIRKLDEINTNSNEAHPNISPDGLILYFTSNRNGVEQVFKATRASIDEAFSNVEHITFFDTKNGHSAQFCFSSDEKAIYFVKNQNGDKSTRDIYVSYFTGDTYPYKNKLSTDTLYEIFERSDNEE